MLAQLGSSLHSFWPDKVQILYRAVVVSDCDSEVFVDNNMPPAGRNEHGFSRSLSALDRCILFRPRRTANSSVDGLEPRDAFIRMFSLLMSHRFDDVAGCIWRDQNPTFVSNEKRVPRTCSERIYVNCSAGARRAHHEPSVRRPFLVVGVVEEIVGEKLGHCVVLGQFLRLSSLK